MVHLPVGGHGYRHLLERRVVVVGIGKHHLVRVRVRVRVEVRVRVTFRVRVRVRVRVGVRVRVRAGVLNATLGMLVAAVVAAPSDEARAQKEKV